MSEGRRCLLPDDDAREFTYRCALCGEDVLWVVRGAAPDGSPLFRGLEPWTVAPTRATGRLSARLHSDFCHRADEARAASRGRARRVPRST